MVALMAALIAVVIVVPVLVLVFIRVAAEAEEGPRMTIVLASKGGS